MCLNFIWRFVIRKYVGWREWQHRFCQSGWRMATLLEPRLPADFVRIRPTPLKHRQQGRGGGRPASHDSQWNPDARRLFNIVNPRQRKVVDKGVPSGPGPPQPTSETTPTSAEAGSPDVIGARSMKKKFRPRKKKEAGDRARSCIWMGGIRYELARMDGLTMSEQPLATDCFCRGLELGLFAPRTEETEEFRIQLVRTGLKIQNSSLGPSVP